MMLILKIAVWLGCSFLCWMILNDTRHKFTLAEWLAILFAPLAFLWFVFDVMRGKV